MVTPPGISTLHVDHLQLTMYLVGVPTISIMAITGHRTEKAFLNYIKVTPNEHAIKLKDFWERNKMELVR